jgi:pyruvate carboxylase
MAPFATTKTIKRLMCCNRGEIAIRVFRCCKENGIKSIAIFSEQDKLGLHRYKADEAYKVEAPNGSPVGAYLAIDAIIKIAKEHRVDAIHPGYGFLSENADMAAKCRDNGIIFIGPNPETITKMGDKTAAKNVAKECNVPVVPGTDSALIDKEAAYKWCEENGLPVMMKASMGGGGRGMRVVRKMEEVKEAFTRCSSEALTAFGDGSMFIERLIERPRHIEV